MPHRSAGGGAPSAEEAEAEVECGTAGHGPTQVGPPAAAATAAARAARSNGFGRTWTAAAGDRAAADRQAEAEAHFKVYRDACEAGDFEAAREALSRAVALDGRRFQPFDRSRYRLDRVLGAGGFGTVFRCEDTEDADADGRHPLVAVKALRAEDLDRDPRAVFAEARVLRDLYHPGSRLIRVLGWGYAFADPDDPARKARPYIVMEYFPGETLEEVVRRDGPLPLPDFLAVARQVAEAVQEAHRQGVYHRDLKPSNVMARRSPDGGWDVRVIDFGLAVRDEAAHRASRSLAAGRATAADRRLTGTLDFAPPEQRGRLPGVRVGPYSDVFAYGKTCQWLLFRTTEPKRVHWERLPAAARDPLQTLLETATFEEVEGRHPDFGPVLDALSRLELSDHAPVPQGRPDQAEALPTAGPTPSSEGESLRATAAPVPDGRCTAWGTVQGTGAASIDIVLMAADGPLTEREIGAEIDRQGLPSRGAIGSHLATLKRRGHVMNTPQGWIKAAPPARQGGDGGPARPDLQPVQPPAGTRRSARGLTVCHAVSSQDTSEGAGGVDDIRLLGTSASDRRAPREMDLRAEDDEIRFHIHNPGASQWIFWVGRPELEASLGGWDWRRAAEIPVSARKTAAPLKVVIKLFADGDEELEVQAGKYWMWLKAADLADALTRLGVRLDRPAA